MTSLSADDSQKALKRSWLNLLPLEQVIEIVFKLEELVPASARKDIWPDDVNAAVLAMSAKGKGRAVEVIESRNEQNHDGHDSINADETRPPTLDTSQLPSEPVSTPSQPQPPTLHETTQTQPEPVSAAGPTPIAADSISLSTPVSTPLPPTHSSPPPSLPVMTPAAAAAMSQGQMPYPYTHYPYTSYSYHLPNANQQPYPYSYSHPPVPSAAAAAAALIVAQTPPPRPIAPFTSVPLTRSAAPPATVSISSPAPKAGTSTPGEGDNDLPSYEEMIVHALAEFNDPTGTAPKQLFQWMAARYPVQQNFRPSASQALQKAYRRGRFEKSTDGKYRLNASWNGGATSKRTTRRPQSQIQASTNPHPSSHPPPNGSPYPAYPWPYPNGANQASPHSSPAAVAAAAAGVGGEVKVNVSSTSPSQPQPQTQAVARTLQAAGLGGDQLSQDQEHDPETAREAWAAAQSILQALNIGALLQQVQEESANATVGEGPPPMASLQPDSDGAVPGTSATANTTASSSADGGAPVVSLGVVPPVSARTIAAGDFPPPIFAGDISFGSSPTGSGLAVRNSLSQAASAARPSNAQPPAHLPTPPSTAGLATAQLSVSLGVSSGLAALQGSLALLAAQLADIAGADTSNARTILALGGRGDGAMVSLSLYASECVASSSSSNPNPAQLADLFGDR